MKVNYHTHTPRCNHAFGSEREYIESAIRGGFQVLGFADHTPWPYENFTSRIRMDVSQLDDYVTTLQALKEEYRDRIQIMIGLEVEYFPKYLDYLYLLKKSGKIDYFILGNHFFESDEYGKERYYGRNTKDDAMMDRYCETCIEAMQTGLYTYLAHPDLFMRGRKVFDAKAEAISRKIIQASIDFDIPLEYNLEGMKFNETHQVEEYPHHRFWEIAAEYQPKVIIGVDAHHYESLERQDLFNKAHTFLTSLNLNLVTTIKTFGKEGKNEDIDR